MSAASGYHSHLRNRGWQDDGEVSTLTLQTYEDPACKCKPYHLLSAEPRTVFFLILCHSFLLVKNGEDGSYLLGGRNELTYENHVNWSWFTKKPSINVTISLFIYKIAKIVFPPMEEL